MPETVMDQIVAELKRAGNRYYPERGELRNVRVVGHTPKNDHYIYDIVIDMSEVEFLDSTGLGVLVGGLKKVRAHDGSLHLVCNQDRLLKIFRITGLAKVFVIHDTAEAALAAS